MAKPDDDLRRTLRKEEAELAVYFDAERTETGAPPAAFLEAVLADAAALAAARLPAARPRTGWRQALGLLRPVGGWAGATALAGCAALGFLAGALGSGSDLMAATLWSEITTIEGAADGVDGFFDLDLGEG